MLAFRITLAEAVSRSRQRPLEDEETVDAEVS
jgi:hypothetical protein